eukprot:SAG11_NODE_3007_length_2773_cov_2.200449_2_plen_365_part_00
MSAWTATGVTQLVGGHRVDSDGAVAAGSSSFTTAPPPLPSVADVVAQGGHDELAAFVQVFQEAAIDTELASEMNATELAGLLPPGTPFGHALRLRKLFAAAAAAAKPRARIPHGPAWQVRCSPTPAQCRRPCRLRMHAVLQHGARFIASGTMQGDLSANLQFILDLVLIISSLLLSLSISPLLAMPEECMDGSDCRSLRSADALLWAVSAGCFLGAVLSGWIVLTLMAAVSTSQRAKWFEDHWGRVVTPVRSLHPVLACPSAGLPQCWPAPSAVMMGPRVSADGPDHHRHHHCRGRARDTAAHRQPQRHRLSGLGQVGGIRHLAAACPRLRLGLLAVDVPQHLRLERLRVLRVPGRSAGAAVAA